MASWERSITVDSRNEVFSCVSSFRVFRGSRSVPQEAEGSIAPRRAHDAAARMRRAAAHPQVPNRRVVLRPPGHRPREEQLLERQFALEDVSFGEPELALEIERRQHLSVKDDVANV